MRKAFGIHDATIECTSYLPFRELVAAAATVFFNIYIYIYFRISVFKLTISLHLK